MKRDQIRRRILKNLRTQGQRQQREQSSPRVARRERTTTLYS